MRSCSDRTRRSGWCSALPNVSCHTILAGISRDHEDKEHRDLDDGGCAWNCASTGRKGGAPLRDNLGYGVAVEGVGVLEHWPGSKKKETCEGDGDRQMIEEIEQIKQVK